MADQPVHRAADVGLVHVLSDGLQGRQHGAHSVDVVDAPPSEPGAVGLLLAANILIGPFERSEIPGIAKLPQHFHDVGGNVNAGRVQSFAEV